MSLRRSSGLFHAVIVVLTAVADVYLVLSPVYRVELSLLLDDRARYLAANPGGFQVVIRKGHLTHSL